MIKPLKLGISLFTFFIITVVIIWYCYFESGYLYLIPTSYHRLKDWDKDNHSNAFLAFKNSCNEILKRKFSSSPIQPFTLSKWQKVCTAAIQLPIVNQTSTKEFFEKWFKPYLVTNSFFPNGLFTGYYLPSIQASLVPNANYTIPIYSYPKTFLKINLGQFRKELTGKMITAQLKNNKLIPAPDRAAINQGALENNEVIAWTNDIVDLFFAQIQGSAILTFNNQPSIIISYAGDNGFPYTPIGKVLVRQYHFNLEAISMQSIRAWLLQHPQEVNQVLNNNASYVFFKKINLSMPIGFEEVPITPERTLAVDTHYIPLGAPIWLETKIPNFPNGHPVEFNHLLIAQDTGGAIKGIIRGDIYFGSGDEAAFKAGKMKYKGTYWLLLPK